MDKRVIAFAVIAAISTTSCMNLATKPSEITGSYTSELKYQGYNCDQLGIEVNSLARRENQLVTAQEQRRKSGKVQAFWLGYGTGDGIEAAELANVRGEKEAVRRAMDVRACGTPAASTSSAIPAPQSTTQTAQSPAAAQPTGGNWRNWGTSTSTEHPKTLYRCSGTDGTQVVTETPAAGCTVISP